MGTRKNYKKKTKVFFEYTIHELQQILHAQGTRKNNKIIFKKSSKIFEL